MGFASTWLESRTLFTELVNEAPHPDTGIIIVVPAYNEPELTLLLDSLASCIPPLCKSEVIIVINAPGWASAVSINYNQAAFDELTKWKAANSSSFFKLHFVNLGQPYIKCWGVGLARKAGMDEAVSRFNSINNPDGVIVNLDADCTVEANYFISIENGLLKQKDKKACSIYFEHPVSGHNFSAEVYRSIYQYELHLRYYFQAMLFTGYPDVFHTVGSSMAVRSLPYIKAGGMNRRQAGEDFYFVQKLLPAGGYFSLNSTTVYPSPRASARVPFGTGAAVEKMLDRDEDDLLTYNPSAFEDLYNFFGFTDRLFYSGTEELVNLFSLFPESIQLFLEENIWLSKISEIKNNTSGAASFRKRYYEWFNMFKVVKYLNNSHKGLFIKIPVIKAAEELLIKRQIHSTAWMEKGLLEFYRDLERKR